MTRAKSDARPAPADQAPTDPRRPRTRIRAGALAAALKDVAGVIEHRNTLPILDHVLIDARDGQIVLTASDLDRWAVRSLASDDAGQADSRDWQQGSRGFTVTCPARALASAVGEFDPEAMVTLTAPDGAGTPGGAGPVTIAAGRARFRLHTLPVEDFPLPPPIPAEHAFDLPCTVLADAFAAVEHAVSTEETRYYLNGVYLHPEAFDLRFVATDGHRLARLGIAAPDGGASFPPTIVSRGTVAVLDKLLVGAIKAAGDAGSPPMVTVEASGQRLRFALPAADGGEVELIAKAIDGSFPDYARAIPAAPAEFAKVDRAALLAAVKRVAVLTDSKSRAVRADFSADCLTLSVTTPELGEAREELPCGYAGADLTLGFNSQYLRSVLLALAGDDVALGLPEDAAGPVLVRAWGEDNETARLIQVLMPMRV